MLETAFGVTNLFVKGNRVKHRNQDWGIGVVLEDSVSENVSVHFKGFGNKLLRSNSLLKVEGQIEKTLSMAEKALISKAIQELLPDVGTRKVCLNFLADSITYADSFGSGIWVLTFPGQKTIRLNVGKIYVCSPDLNTMWVVLHNEFLSRENRQKLLESDVECWPLSDATEPTVPWAIECQIPADRFSELLPLFESSHHHLISLAAQSVEERTPHYNHNNPAARLFLHEYLDRSIPEPHY